MNVSETTMIFTIQTKAFLYFPTLGYHLLLACISVIITHIYIYILIYLFSFF